VIRLLYDYQVFSEHKYGGISRYFYEIAETISKSKEIDVKILSPLFINKYLSASDSNIVQGMYIPQVRRTGKIVRYVNRAISRSIVNIRPPDIIHETYYNNTGLVNMGSGCKRVITIHDMIHEKFPGHFKNPEYTQKIKSEATKRADKIICVSENTKKDLIEILNVNPNKISVIHHGYPKIKLNKQSLIRVVARPYILFIGERNGYKNFIRLLAAFNYANLIDDFILVCFGGGKFTKNEIGEMRQLGLRDKNIKHISGGDDKLANLYTFASIFVYPSIYEGFGMPILEAMSYKCPVICSNTSSFPEVAGNAVEYFDPYDVESIAHTLKKALYASKGKKLKVIAGIENLARFSWDKCANTTAEIYLDLI
jgi:glycosyltransferase involved in cell wall biosynthesis